MYPEPIQRLIRHFQKLPGIGPKQGAKFAFRAIRMVQDELDSFAQDLKEIRRETASCSRCHLSYAQDGSKLCPICRNKTRNQQYICVVETERDAYTIEKTRTFTGVYHVLGEKLSLASNSLPAPALGSLKSRLKKLPEKTEVVLAMNATADGQAAALWLERALEPLKIKITRLGRGLSSGIEIEYADKDTLIDAFRNRK